MGNKQKCRNPKIRRKSESPKIPQNKGAKKKAYAMLEKIVDLALKGDAECQKFILDILEEADRIEREEH